MNSARELWESGWDRIAASALGQKVWAHYESAAPREQLMLKLLGAFFIVLIAVLVIVLPLHQFHKNSVAGYVQQQETLAWMQSNRALVGSASGPSARKPGDSLLTIANQSARPLGLGFKRYEPHGEKGLNLWLEKVPFNQVVAWLAVLERDYGVVATDFSASRRDEAGMVDVRVSLEG